MEFCNKCDNIYYIEIAKNGKLNYKCKKCKNSVNLNEINEKSYLIKTNIQKKKASYEYIINEYTKYDNTLPRIKHIKCPKCSKQTKPKASPESSQPEEVVPKVQEKQSGKLKEESSQIFDDDDDVVVDEEDNVIDEEDIFASEGGADPDLNNDEVIFIRYDDINLKYIYLCCNRNAILNGNYNKLKFKNIL